MTETDGKPFPEVPFDWAPFIEEWQANHQTPDWCRDETWVQTYLDLMEEGRVIFPREAINMPKQM